MKISSVYMALIVANAIGKIQISIVNVVELQHEICCSTPGHQCRRQKQSTDGRAETMSGITGISQRFNLYCQSLLSKYDALKAKSEKSNKGVSN
jgi:hypothetical protein